MNENIFEQYYTKLPIFYRFLQEIPIEVVHNSLTKLDYNIVYLEKMEEYNSHLSNCFMSDKPISKISK